jgi:PIN domain nuclease of toxin-antitoxin system
MAGNQSMILDTCALLWLAAGDKKLGRKTLKEINEAPAVYVSAISSFEVAIKSARGKLKLPHSPREWFDKVVEHHGLTVLPLDVDACVGTAELPPIHDDPCDRFIIAIAKLNDLPVVTADDRFEKYGVTVLA